MITALLVVVGIALIEAAVIVYVHGDLEDTERRCERLVRWNQSITDTLQTLHDQQEEWCAAHVRVEREACAKVGDRIAAACHDEAEFDGWEKYLVAQDVAAEIRARG